MPSLPNSVDSALRQRAARVVPGGMWGHLHAARLPEGYPQFFARGEGCRLWDVDGNEYVDLMCSWGRSCSAIAIPASRRRCAARRPRAAA